MEAVNCLRCEYKDADNGNCTAVGGFCTAVPAAHCPLLRQYLGTGMTPEQAANAKTIIESAFADDASKAERIRKLLAADGEGRVVMLPPCKYGDTLYCLENGKIYPKTITLIAFYLQDTLRTIIITAKNYRGETNGFLASELGKTMFLSLEEAERALEEQKNV